MNKIEFRKRLYANPLEVDRELLAAAGADPALQKILEQTRELETEVVALLHAMDIPSGLADKLMAIADTASTETGLQKLEDVASKPAANNNFFQYYAIAASLLLALEVTFSLTFDSGPSSAEMAVSDDVLRHLYIAHL